jgi:hypothetical protein
MEFKQFNLLLQKHVSKMTRDVNKLFVVDIDKDILWNTYLDSFPEGTNKIFRERREYDCSCCRHFIKNFGNVVSIKNGKLNTIWGFKTEDGTYQPVIDALDSLIKGSAICNVFLSPESKFGTAVSYENTDDGRVIAWDHFHVSIDSKFSFRANRDPLALNWGSFVIQEMFLNVL